MSATTMFVDLNPILLRWFKFTETQYNDPDIAYAVKDIITHTALAAVDQASDIDVLGASFFLENSGWSSNILQSAVNEVATTTRSIYLNQTTPEWRNSGVKHIQIDQRYLMTVRLGIDPYV
jgi:hypothetical protein